MHEQVMQKLKAEATSLKGVVVSALLSASNTFITARRLLAGVDLRYALQPPTAGAKLTALLTAALLAPVYALAQKLVFNKVSTDLHLDTMVRNLRSCVDLPGSLYSQLC